MSQKRTAAKVVTKPDRDPLTGRVLRAASKKAFATARAKAFETHATLLAARDGWLVEVDRTGAVKKKIRRLDATIRR